MHENSKCTLLRGYAPPLGALPPNPRLLNPNRRAPGGVR